MGYYRDAPAAPPVTSSTSTTTPVTMPAAMAIPDSGAWGVSKIKDPEVVKPTAPTFAFEMD